MSKHHDTLDHLYNHSVDINNRRVFLYFPLEDSEHPGDDIASQVCKSILLLDKTQGPIELWINTPGGDMGAMFSIYDVLQACRNNVITIGFGEVCSAGGLILVSGDIRMVTRNCIFMHHSPEIGCEYVPVKSAEHRMEFTKKIIDRWLKLLAQHTSHSKRWWKQKMEGELWLTAEQMIQKRHGIADGYYDSNIYG